MKMQKEAKQIKVLKKVKKEKIKTFNEEFPLYRKTVKVNELFDIIKCLRKNFFNEERCKNCAYLKFCQYPLRYNISYY
jgi:hypothetical protein